MIRYEVIQKKEDGKILVAGGVVFADGVTFLRWTDGSQALSIYPTHKVLYGITADEGEVYINWIDGEPVFEHTHENTHEHTH